MGQWSDAENAALIASWRDSLDAPVHLVSNLSEYMHDRFVYRCGGANDRMPKTVNHHLKMIQNMAMLVRAYNARASKTQADDDAPLPWFDLSAKRRRRVFETHNQRSYGYFEFDVKTYKTIVKLIKRSERRKKKRRALQQQTAVDRAAPDDSEYVAPLATRSSSNSRREPPSKVRAAVELAAAVLANASSGSVWGAAPSTWSSGSSTNMREADVSDDEDEDAIDGDDEGDAIGDKDDDGDDMDGGEEDDERYHDAHEDEGSSSEAEWTGLESLIRVAPRTTARSNDSVRQLISPPEPLESAAANEDNDSSTESDSEVGQWGDSGNDNGTDVDAADTNNVDANEPSRPQSSRASLLSVSVAQAAVAVLPPASVPTVASVPAIESATLPALVAAERLRPHSPLLLPSSPLRAIATTNANATDDADTDAATLPVATRVTPAAPAVVASAMTALDGSVDREQQTLSNRELLDAVRTLELQRERFAALLVQAKNDAAVEQRERAREQQQLAALTKSVRELMKQTRTSQKQRARAERMRLDAAEAAWAAHAAAQADEIAGLRDEIATLFSASRALSDQIGAVTASWTTALQFSQLSMLSSTAAPQQTPEMLLTAPACAIATTTSALGMLPASVPATGATANDIHAELLRSTIENDTSMPSAREETDGVLSGALAPPTALGRLPSSARSAVLASFTSAHPTQRNATTRQAIESALHNASNASAAAAQALARVESTSSSDGAAPPPWASSMDSSAVAVVALGDPVKKNRRKPAITQRKAGMFVVGPAPKALDPPSESPSATIDDAPTSLASANATSPPANGTSVDGDTVTQSPATQDGEYAIGKSKSSEPSFVADSTAESSTNASSTEPTTTTSIESQALEVLEHVAPLSRRSAKRARESSAAILAYIQQQQSALAAFASSSSSVTAGAQSRSQSTVATLDVAFADTTAQSALESESMPPARVLADSSSTTVHKVSTSTAADGQDVDLEELEPVQKKSRSDGKHALGSHKSSSKSSDKSSSKSSSILSIKSSDKSFKKSSHKIKHKTKQTYQLTSDSYNRFTGAKFVPDAAHKVTAKSTGKSTTKKLLDTERVSGKKVKPLVKPSEYKVSSPPIVWPSKHGKDSKELRVRLHRVATVVPSVVTKLLATKASSASLAPATTTSSKNVVQPSTSDAQPSKNVAKSRSTTPPPPVSAAATLSVAKLPSKPSSSATVTPPPATAQALASASKKSKSTAAPLALIKPKPSKNVATSRSSTPPPLPVGTAEPSSLPRTAKPPALSTPTPTAAKTPASSTTSRPSKSDTKSRSTTPSPAISPAAATPPAAAPAAQPTLVARTKPPTSASKGGMLSSVSGKVKSSKSDAKPSKSDTRSSESDVKTSKSDTKSKSSKNDVKTSESDTMMRSAAASAAAKLSSRSPSPLPATTKTRASTSNEHKPTNGAKTSILKTAAAKDDAKRTALLNVTQKVKVLEESTMSTPAARKTRSTVKVTAVSRPRKVVVTVEPDRVTRSRRAQKSDAKRRRRRRDI